MTNRYLFEEQSLPAGFKLPESYLQVLSQPELPDLEPWWLLTEDKKLALLWADTLRRLYPVRSLLPFAKRDGSDDLACFDGSDTTGDPKVFYVHAYASSGWEHAGEVASFEEWLRRTGIESERFKVETD